MDRIEGTATDRDENSTAARMPMAKEKTQMLMVLYRDVVGKFDGSVRMKLPLQAQWIAWLSWIATPVLPC